LPTAASSRLIPDIVRLNGYISVGPAILNDHAVNYRALARKIPADRLLVETDRTEENAAECPSVRDVLAKLAEIRGEDPAALESQTDANADRFCRNLESVAVFADGHGEALLEDVEQPVLRAEAALTGN